MLSLEESRAWSAALRSGEYDQCRHAWSNDGKDHSCLNVLSHLLNRPVGPPRTKFRETTIRSENSAFIEGEVRELEKFTRAGFIAMNDDLRFSFSEIADEIDKAAEKIEVDRQAKVLYDDYTANGPIHCNRFPSWRELPDVQKDNWRRRVQRDL